MKSNRLPLLAAFVCSASMLTGALIVTSLSASESSPTMAAVSAVTLPIVPVQVKFWIDREVISTDGLRVGEMVDCVLQFGKLPQLRYVIVKSGALLSGRGEDRAIPADAITLVDNRLRVNLTRAAYLQLPVLPSNRASFLSDPDNLMTMARLCNTPLDHADLNGDYIAYTDLVDARNVEGRNGEILGYFSDLWVDFNANEAPYLEFVPTSLALSPQNDPFFELPTTKLESIRSNRIHFAIAEDEILSSRFVDDFGRYVAAAGQTLQIVQTKTER